jgi:hypothetical protein
VREPSTSERLNYLSRSIKKVNGSIVDNFDEIFSIKFEYGCKLITGFPDLNEKGEAQFTIEDKLISCDPKSENYFEDWKDLILPNFINQIIVLSTKYYDGIDLSKPNGSIKKIDEVKPGPEVSDEAPLKSSS